MLISFAVTSQAQISWEHFEPALPTCQGNTRATAVETEIQNPDRVIFLGAYTFPN